MILFSVYRLKILYFNVVPVKLTRWLLTSIISGHRSKFKIWASPWLSCRGHRLRSVEYSVRRLCFEWIASKHCSMRFEYIIFKITFIIIMASGFYRPLGIGLTKFVPSITVLLMLHYWRPATHVVDLPCNWPSDTSSANPRPQINQCLGPHVII